MTNLSDTLAALSEAAARFYIDCEFDGHDGPLLSMALVKDDDDGIHIQTRTFATDPWVLENVMPLMDMHSAPKSATVYGNEVGEVIRAFIGDCSCPVIVADSPVDIGRFCRALSTGTDGGWVSADYPRMTFEVHNVDCYPTDLHGAVQHNAWWDAMALRHRLAYRSGQLVPVPDVEKVARVLRDTVLWTDMDGQANLSTCAVDDDSITTLATAVVAAMKGEG